MKRALLVFGSCLLASLASCHDSSGSPPAVEPEPQPQPEPVPEPPSPVEFLGEPLDGLTDEELAAFERGRELFSHRFKPSEGMGPLYNATSCSSCHSKPVPGGGADLYRNFYLAAVGFSFFQSALPGLPSVVVPAFGSPTDPNFTLEAGRTRMPSPAQLGSLELFMDQRNSIPTFGVGLFERVSDATILTNADPDDLDGDGISGRANNDGAGLGRLGTKAQANNIELFVRAPLFNQMGITTMPFQGDGATASLGHGAFFAQASGNPNDPTVDTDGVPDPELAADKLGDLIAFARFMAPPRQRDFNEAAIRGKQSFGDLGCAKCHIPELPSSSGPVLAFTDLLIHHMGPELAGEVSLGTPQMGQNDPSSTAAEWRTAPLWGVSYTGPWLHDGRAPTLDEAILLHGGEAKAIREAYAALPQAGRDDILEFLRHL